MGQELDLLKARRDRVEEQLDAATDGALEARLLLEYEHLEKEVKEMELKELAQVGRGLPAKEDLTQLSDAELIAQSDELKEAAKGLVHISGTGSQSRMAEDAASAKLVARANALSAEARRRAKPEPGWENTADLTAKLDLASRSGDYEKVEEYHAALKSIVDSMGGEA